MNADRLRNRNGQLWLNVASSYAVLEEFVNIDNSVFIRLLPAYRFLKFLFSRGHSVVFEKFLAAKSRAKLIRHDCRRPLRLPDDSVDHILCSHFLEHIYPDEARKTLGDFHRVLKKGGTLHVVIPDLRALADRYVQRAGSPCAADDLVRATILTKECRDSLPFRFLEFLGGYGLQHRWMYDKASMSAKLRETGFELIDVNDTPSASYRCSDETSAHVVGRKP